MSNTLALLLALSVLCAVGIDYALFGTEHLIFLGRRLFDLVEWLAFWR